MTAPDIEAFRPQPLPDPDSRPFWEHLSRGELAIQRCAACAAWQFPLLERCRHCAGELRMERLSGRGTIYTFIVEHRVVVPGFDAELPYAIVLVTPEEAPEVRIPSRIMGSPLAEVRVGRAVQAEIVDLAGSEYKVPVFRIVG